MLHSEILSGPNFRVGNEALSINMLAKRQFQVSSRVLRETHECGSAAYNSTALMAHQTLCDSLISWIPHFMKAAKILMNLFTSLCILDLTFIIQSYQFAALLHIKENSIFINP